MRESPPFHNLPQEILSKIRPLPDPSSAESFAIDGRGPKGVISVGSLQETAEFLKAASKANISVIPRGSGTKMGWGNPPRAADLMLDLSGLRGILEYNPENLTVTTECGLPLSELQEALATKGQFLPLDPSYFRSASLGGIVSCNAYGPKRLIYGTARDMVLGMRVALVDGSLVNFGGRCVKNVSGYDLCKLFIGSLGTLGIIGEMTFKVHPLPEQEAIQVASFREPTKALGLCQSLLHSALFPAALEILDPLLAGVWTQEMGIPHEEQDWLLLIGWAGFSEDVSRLIGEGKAAFSEHQAREDEVCESGRARKGWEILGHLTTYLKVSPEGFVLCRICLPLTQVGEGMARWKAEVLTPGVKPSLLVRAGCGILYGYLLEASRDEERTFHSLEKMRKWSMDRGGSLILEHAPLWLKERMDVWGAGGKEIALMSRLKHHFDPLGVLNGGRYLEGI